MDMGHSHLKMCVMNDSRFWLLSCVSIFKKIFDISGCIQTTQFSTRAQSYLIFPVHLKRPN